MLDHTALAQGEGTLPGLLRANLLRGLASAEVPLPCPRLPMYMVWHLRHQDDPVHRWWRDQVDAAVAEALATGGTNAG